MNQSQIVLKLSLGVLLAVALESCAPPQITNRTKTRAEEVFTRKPAPPSEPIDYELIPTEQRPQLPESSGIKYENPISKIKTEQTTLHLNQVKMSKVALSYDMQKHTLAIKGIAEIFDDTQRLLAENSFAIIGEAKSDEDVITLTSANREKINSKLKPVIRAQATCLATTINDEPDCSRVVIDFFIAYQQKVYTEQMEIKSSVTNLKSKPIPEGPSAPVTTATPAVANKSAADDANDPTELQKEDSENSVPGRFEGQAEAVDLKKVFDEDDEIQTVLKAKTKPVAKPEEKKKEQPVKPTDKKEPLPVPTAPAVPTAPKVETKPEPTTPPKVNPDATPKLDPQPEPKAEPKTEGKSEPKNPQPEVMKVDGKDKPVTADVAETKSGDLRPRNQAVGFPDEGALRNATSLIVTQKNLDRKSFFEIVYPDRQRYFATYEMAEMLTRLGEHLHAQFNKTLAVSDISRLKGGLLSPHQSHQIGMDADIAYPSTSDQVKFPVVVEMHTRRFNQNSFSIEKTFDLLKFASQQEDLRIDRIFIDRSIKASLCQYAKEKGELTGADKDVVQQLFKSMEHINGHGDHFHLRLKCTSAHPGCRRKNYIEVTGCL